MNADLFPSWVSEVRWDTSTLGPPSTWPLRLCHALELIEANPLPAVIFWGATLIPLPNTAALNFAGSDAATAVVGHPLPDTATTPWGVCATELAPLFSTGKALTYTDRPGSCSGDPAQGEHYSSAVISPLRGEDTDILGLLMLLTDTTARVQEARELAVLHDLARAGVGASTGAQLGAAVVRVLAAYPHHFGFAALYLLDYALDQAMLVGATPAEAGALAAPTRIALRSDEEWPEEWPFGRVVHPGAGEYVVPASPRNARLGRATEPARAVLLLPLTLPEHEQPAGILVVGFDPQASDAAATRARLRRVARRIVEGLGGVLATESNQRRLAEASTLDREKSAFFISIGHEFLTPLTLLLGPLQTLLRNSSNHTTASQRELLLIVQRGGVRLFRLVNTLLQFMTLETGNVSARRQPTDLAQYTSDLASMFRPAVEAAGVQLHVDCPPLARPVAIDRGMWERIVLNLLSNAVKYTHAGQITVTLRAVPFGSTGGVCLTVSDTGIGIAAANIPRLFERYRRVRELGGRTQEGLGLGLVLVHEMARLHDGIVGVESVVGQGSSFSVTIPLTPLDQLSAPPESALDHAPARAQAPTPYVAEALRWLPRVATAEGRPQTGAGPGSGARAGFVLIADANADMRGYLRRLLLPHWPIEEVATAAEALELARTQAPSLILIDVLLPDMDGLHLVRLLRTDAATAALPVILLSAQQGEEMIVAGLEAGADDYLTKPFVASEFLARVEVHTTLSRLRREASQLREEYIAAFAHDLHTPFTSIQVGVGLLQADAARYLPQPAREVLDTVQRNIQRLALHLSDLVTVNQLNAGVLQTRSETLDLRLLVGEALNTVQPLFQEKGQTTQVRLPDELLVRGDARRTQQVLMNVLMNAHRHTPMGTTITVERYVGPAEAGVVICDNGAGIAPQHRERIFERHQRLDTVSGGSGLGLTIARSLLGLQGGRIWAEAADGGGACFFIVLPVADRRSSESMEEES